MLKVICFGVMLLRRRYAQWSCVASRNARLLWCVGKGRHARVWAAEFWRRDRKRLMLVKRIQRPFDLIASLDWRRAGFASPPRHSLRAIDMSHVDHVDCDVADMPVAVDTVITPFVWGTRRQAPMRRDLAQELCLGGNFLTEAAVGHLITVHVVPHVPSFCALVDAWASRRHGNLVMPYCGMQLSDALPRLSLAQVQSAVLQVLAGLAWAQQSIAFKHHDLHCGNVFVSFRAVAQRLALPDGRAVELPCGSVRAVIADYGVSAATDPASGVRYARADYNTLCVRGAGWGSWNATLFENEGYDAAVLLASMTHECESRVVLDWLATMTTAMHELDADMRVSHSRGRPTTAVRVSPLQLLSHNCCRTFLWSDTAQT